jgi:tRNA A-37 threonylcarbamoyl transferase component Bud32
VIDDDTVASGEPPPSDGDEAFCSACNQSFPPDTTTCPNDGARLVRFKAAQDALLGRTLDERFRIEAALGRGGMGTVYRAWQLSVDRPVAIKVVRDKLAHDRIAAKRFLREARLASRLNQPNVVNVYDFGQTDDGVLYLAMELLRGHTLADELRGGKRLSVRRTCTIAMQLCDALEAAHRQGIVHRDLKPSNIVILDEPPGRDLIKVLDFGLAKSLVADTTSNVTHSGALLGTPLYMAPEQIEGEQSDARADLYSVGCILFELLAGQPPFPATTIKQILELHLTQPPPALPDAVPEPLRALIAQLLAKAPGDRPGDAAKVRAVLAGVLGGAPDAEASARLHSQEIAKATAETIDASAARPRRRRWLVPIAAVVVAGGGAAAWLATRGEPAPAVVVPRDAPAAPLAKPLDAPAPDAAIDAPPAVPVDAAVRPDAPPAHHHARVDAGDPEIHFLPR